MAQFSNAYKVTLYNISSELWRLKQHLQINHQTNGSIGTFK